MEIRIDGDRTTSEVWMRAHRAPANELPCLTDEQKVFAEKFGQSPEEFARSIYAGQLGLADLEKKAERAAQVVQRFAEAITPAIKVTRVWLKTFDGRFRFDFSDGNREGYILVKEDLIDDLMESGSLQAEEQIRRILWTALPQKIEARAS